MNKFLIGGAGAAAGLGIAGAAAAAYVAKAVQGRATGDLQGLLDGSNPPTSEVVVFLGASIVKGRASVDFVDMVRTELPDLQIANAGENGQTVRDLLARVDGVVAVKPRDVVILIGTNDVQAVLDPAGATASRQAKAHGAPPTLASYLNDLTELVTDIQVRTGAKTALCTLPPLGQDLDSEPNRVVREFNAAIHTVGERTGSTVLDVYQRLAQILIDEGAADTKPFTGKWQPGRRSLTSHFIVGRSYDDIAAKEGLLLSPDYVHLNTRGAQVIADLAIDYLQRPAVANPNPGEAERVIDDAASAPEQRSGEPAMPYSDGAASGTVGELPDEPEPTTSTTTTSDEERRASATPYGN